MNTLGLAAPNRIRCTRAADARPVGGSLRLRGLVVDKDERFWSRVNRDGPAPAYKPELGPCWLWTGTRSHGYGRFGLGQESLLAHRIAWELANGPVPDGLELDHLCRVTVCVNPAHLEAVTHRENTLRGEGPTARHARLTHCPKGHEYSSANTRLAHRGTSRECVICTRDRDRIRKRREKGARLRGERAMTARIIRDGWHNAEYGCPDCEWTLYISFSDRLTTWRLHAWYGPQLAAHRSAAHPGSIPLPATDKETP
jgi:hypothetical protein